MFSLLAWLVLLPTPLSLLSAMCLLRRFADIFFAAPGRALFRLAAVVVGCSKRL